MSESKNQVSYHDPLLWVSPKNIERIKHRPDEDPNTELLRVTTPYSLRVLKIVAKCL